ncbi:hypothetical protein ACFYTQ_33465 [Nocardia sp. NPDC004068]|uniref:hypothetical protein n=1 Tax=Nocardia sp. NPDC004068 TaxID=3364303 RepID=UPI0036795F32
MSEKLPNTNEHNDYEDNGPTHANETQEASPTPVVEHDSEAEWQLRWAVSEALLRAVYDAVERPGEHIRSAAVTVAIEVVQATRAFDLRSEDDQRALAARADYVADRIIELAGAYDDLTTSDLQGAVEALSLRLVRNQLPIGDTEQTEGGDHE